MSWQFVALVAAAMAVYYLPSARRAQPVILLAASLAFYVSHDVYLTGLLILAILGNAWCRRGILNAPKPRAALAWCSAGVAWNLGILGAFKYGALLAVSFLPAAWLAGEEASFWLSLPLPLGISFYSFSGISLVVDQYRRYKDGTPAPLAPPASSGMGRTVLGSALYLAFFPKLVAGPIARAYDFLPQMGPKVFGDIPWQHAFKALTVGYFLKMVVADNLAGLTFWISYPQFSYLSSSTLLALTLGYTMQIFADFAGYSLIAIGVAALFGYHLPTNFNFPYIARSFREFWQRWHITLSGWLRDYLYIPLGGNRVGKNRALLNIMIVMFLGGLWHGAAWSFAVWGLWHGTALCAERLLRPFLLGVKDRSWFQPLRLALVFAWVAVGWLLFKLTDFSHALAYMQAIFTNSHMEPNNSLIWSLAVYSLPVALYHLAYLVRHRLTKMPGHNWRQALGYGALWLLILTNSGAPGAFIYFQF